jgi:putative glutamine amidotransferase
MAWLMTALALRRAGARPLRITPANPCDPKRLDGFVIGGGTDVDPFHYGEPRKNDTPLQASEHYSWLEWLVSFLLTVFRTLFAAHSAQAYDPDRDHLEQHLIQYALYNDLPVLGICRGAQLMNVTLGGSLHQHIGHFYSQGTGNIRSVLPRKSVSLVTGCQLQRILKMSTCRVNALHDQSINKLGDQLLVSAQEQSGVIQAIERNTHPYFLGVQWHPEYMPQSRVQQQLFRSLVRRASSPISERVAS